MRANIRPAHGRAGFRLAVQKPFAQTRAVAGAMMFDFIRAVRHQHYPFAITFFSVIFATGASRLTRMPLQPDGLSRI
jgi:hypothetical protein